MNNIENIKSNEVLVNPFTFNSSILDTSIISPGTILSSDHGIQWNSYKIANEVIISFRSYRPKGNGIIKIKSINSDSSVEIPLIMDENVDSSFNVLDLTNESEFSNNNTWYRGYYLQYYDGYKYFLDDFYLSNSILQIYHAGYHYDTLSNYVLNNYNINNLSFRNDIYRNIEPELGHNLSYFCSNPKFKEISFNNITINRRLSSAYEDNVVIDNDFKDEFTSSSPDGISRDWKFFKDK